MSDRKAGDHSLCSWCAGPLPDPDGALAIVHGPDGTILLTCDTRCLAELVAALAGRPERVRHAVAARRY